MADSVLHIDLHAGQALAFPGAQVHVALIEKSGKRARLRITAPREQDVKVVPADTPMRGSVEPAKG